MSGKIVDTVEDAKLAGTFVKTTGAIPILSIAVVVLAVALVASMVTAKVGPDRYTGSDHRVYASDHREDHRILDQELAITETEIVKAREDLAVLKSQISGVERDLAEIKSILLRSNDR